MIPILYGQGATSFENNGIGRLTDTISCIVTEERNGIFTLELQYVATGVHFDKLVNGNIVVADASHKLKRQAFEIYKVTKPINNIVTVYANHISYRQSYVPIKPFIATGITQTIEGFSTNAMETSPFTFTTDLDNEDTIYNQNVPKSLRNCLGGSEGSVLDTFSGSSGVEYEFDNFNTFITLHRGENNGVQLRYKKNITDINQEETIENVITGVVPYWINEEYGIVVIGDVQYNEEHKDDYSYNRVELLDLTTEYEETPSVAELNQTAYNFINRTNQGVPNININVSFIEAPQMFGSVEIYENLNLCDTVEVIYSPLGIKYNSTVIKTVFNTLKERYENIEIGDTRSNIASTITSTIGDISSLKIANRNIISITQYINDQVGVIQQSVGSISSTLYDENGLVQKVETNATAITQKTDVISFEAYKEQVSTDMETLEKQVETIGTRVDVTTQGLEIKQNKDDTNYFLITSTDAQVIVDGNVSATFGVNGTSTTELTLDGTWHQDTVNNGNTYILYYLEDE